jgi:hypothetical protein
MRQRRYIVMSFGLGGNIAYGLDGEGKFTSRWGLDPKGFEQALADGKYLAAELEGCTLINQRQVLRTNEMLAIEAPMIDVLLGGDEVCRAEALLKGPEAAVAMELVATHQPAAAVLAAKALTSSRFQGLDAVSPSVYVRWWEAHGAQIGCVRGGRVEWKTRAASASNRRAA